MKNFETLEEFQEYNRKKSKEYYKRKKSDPDFMEKRRKYGRDRYKKMVDKLKATEE